MAAGAATWSDGAVVCEDFLPEATIGEGAGAAADAAPDVAVGAASSPFAAATVPIVDVRVGRGIEAAAGTSAGGGPWLAIPAADMPCTHEGAGGGGMDGGGIIEEGAAAVGNGLPTKAAAKLPAGDCAVCVIGG